MSVVVFGSLNADTVLQVADFPAPGETIRGQDVWVGPGGKGLNQAVASARMGAPTTMVGAVGTDTAGTGLLEGLAAETGLDVSRVERRSGATGQAFVSVDSSGENTIVIVAGANGTHTAASAAEALEFLTPEDVLVCQLEVPLPAVRSALEHAAGRGVRTLLNAAPAAPVADLLSHVDLLIVNETEADAILASSGLDLPAGASRADQAAALFRHSGTDVVITLGSAGLVHASADGSGEVAAFPVDVVDTTGAGDAFVGALAARLCAGEALADALVFASGVGALACTVPGAQGYRGSARDVLEFIASSGGGA